MREHNDFYIDESADDVDQRLAIVVVWPFSNSMYEIEQELSQIVSKAAQEGFITGASPHTRVSTYRVGPAASGLFLQVLFTAYEDVRPYLNDGASLIALAQFTKATFRYLRKRFQNVAEEIRVPGRFDPEQFRPVFSKPMIIGLCYDHFAGSYAEPEGVRIDIRVRSKFPVITSVKHPGGMEMYTVRISTERTNYIYVVDSNGQCVEHFKIKDDELESLELPNWFDEQHSGMFGAEDAGSFAVNN